MITLIEFNNVGSVASEVPITVDDKGIEYEIVAGKKGVSFQNHGNVPVWYGDQTVSPSNFIGNKFDKEHLLIYKAVRSTFKVHFKTAPGEKSVIGVVTHD